MFVLYSSWSGWIYMIKLKTEILTENTVFKKQCGTIFLLLLFFIKSLSTKNLDPETLRKFQEAFFSRNSLGLSIKLEVNFRHSLSFPPPKDYNASVLRLMGAPLLFLFPTSCLLILSTMCVFASSAWRTPKVSSHVNNIKDFGAPKGFLHHLLQKSLTLLKELKAKIKLADLHNAKRVAPGTQCASLEGHLSPTFHRVLSNPQEPFTTKEQEMWSVIVSAAGWVGSRDT